MAGTGDVGVVEALLTGKTYAQDDSQGVWTSAWGARGINWCERDFVHSPFVAETWNTVSNLAFVLAGLAARRLALAHALPRRFFALSWSLVLLGLASGAFHATLLWTAQKLDETMENLALVALFHSDHPSQALALAHSAIVAIGVFTVTAFLFCELHLIGIVLLTLWKVRKRVDAAEVASQGRTGLGHAVRLAAGSALLGFACWLVDRLLCSQVLQLALNPQLHAWWHVLCGVALYESFVLAAALHALNESLAAQRPLPLPLLRTGPCWPLHAPAWPHGKES